jgi:signal transduction histidine kinase/CheY-like chemotaxis protein
MTQSAPDHQDLEVIVQKSGDGLLVVDEEGVIRFLNPAASAFLAKPANELLGRLFDHPCRPGPPVEIAIVRDNGKPGVGELRAVDIQWQGKRARLVSIGDVSERAIFDRLKDDFVSNVSHELRTPLTAIREAVSLMRDGILGTVSEEQVKFLTMCIRNADHLRRIVDTILDISKIEAGRVRMAKKNSELVEIVQATVEAFTPVAASKGLSLEMRPPAEPVRVFADRDRITQVLNNLIGNALKFTASGAIGVSVEAKDGTAVCSVTDPGRGIAKEDLPKVFGKFQQFGAPADPNNKGTGLGLAISREIVRLHAGDMSVRSVLDHGSTFSFTLPVYRPELEVFDHLDARLAESKNPFLLFCVHLNDTAPVEKAAGTDWLDKVTHRIHRTLESGFRSVSSMRLDPDRIFLTLESAQTDGVPARRKLLRGIKEAFFNMGIDDETDFSYGLAAYPRDGESPEALAAACAGNLVHERAERLDQTILIVDDEKALTEATRMLLEIFGYRHIQIANNGMEAFEVLKRTIPGLMILDMKMPGMSGYEVIGRLKESHETKDVPILIMSGYEVEIGRFLEYINRKAILTINKPAEPEILRKMVYYLI